MMQAVNDEGKFKIQANGSLHIIGVHRSDAGMYTCIADNGVGSSALKQIQFEVKGRMNTKQILFMYTIHQNILLSLTFPGFIH